MKIMRNIRLRLPVSILLIITILGSMSALACSSKTSANVMTVYLSFDKAAAQTEEGQFQFKTGDTVNVIAAVIYKKSSKATGEWIFDGEKTSVTFDFPELSEDAEAGDITTVQYQLPTDITGLHTVEFSMKSPDTVSSGKVEYLVDDDPPPANPTSYVVQLVVGNGHAYKDNEGGMAWHDELRMLVGTKVWVPENKYNIPPLDECMASAVLPPNGDDFAIQDITRSNYEAGMDDFEWDTALTPRLVVDEGKGVTFRTQLMEKDADIIGSLLKALAFAWSKAIGFTAGAAVVGPGGAMVGFYVSSALTFMLNKIINAVNSGPDDFIGENLLYLSSAELADIYANREKGKNYGEKTYPTTYDGVNHNKKKGDFKLDLTVYVEQRNVPAPPGPGVYEIQEFLHDGFSISGGNADSGNKEELRLTRLDSSTAGGTATYTPNGEDDIALTDGEAFLWDGAVSDPVRIVDDGSGSYTIDGSKVSLPYISDYHLWENDPGDDEDEFGTSSFSLSMDDIKDIAVSDEGFISMAREFTYDDNGVERDVILNFEVRVRKEPLAYRYVIDTYVQGGENVSGGNTEGGNEEFRLTGTDANGVATIYTPPDSEDLSIGGDGTSFDWSALLSTITLYPIGGNKYVVKSVEKPGSLTDYSMSWSLWEDDSPYGPSGGDEQFGTKIHSFSINELDDFAEGKGYTIFWSKFEGDDGTVKIKFKLVVNKVLNT